MACTWRAFEVHSQRCLPCAVRLWRCEWLHDAAAVGVSRWQHPAHSQFCVSLTVLITGGAATSSSTFLGRRRQPTTRSQRLNCGRRCRSSSTTTVCSNPQNLLIDAVVRHPLLQSAQTLKILLTWRQPPAATTCCGTVAFCADDHRVMVFATAMTYLLLINELAALVERRLCTAASQSSLQLPRRGAAAVSGARCSRSRTQTPTASVEQKSPQPAPNAQHHPAASAGVGRMPRKGLGKGTLLRNRNVFTHHQYGWYRGAPPCCPPAAFGA